MIFTNTGMSRICYHRIHLSMLVCLTPGATTYIMTYFRFLKWSINFKIIQCNISFCGCQIGVRTTPYINFRCVASMVWNAIFSPDRPWISPWIKSISNELDITIHVIASQLSGHRDVISNRLWRHQQNENPASETRGRCVMIVVFIVICGFVMSCKK